MSVCFNSQAQKRSYDDALKLKAVKDAEKKTTKRAVAKVDYDIHAYSNNIMKVFVATRLKTIVAVASDQENMVSCSCLA